MPKMSDKKVIGITGGIASGKTTVSNYLKSLGYFVVSSDEIVKELLLKEHKGYNLIKIHFNEVIENDEEINKNKLASIVFNNQDKRNLLNNLIHPLVKEKIKTIISKSQEKYIFIEVPLLFETDFYMLCDITITVYTNFENQLNRLMKRDNIEKEYAIKKINSQMPLREKIEMSNYSISNDNDDKTTFREVDKLLDLIKS